MTSIAHAASEPTRISPIARYSRRLKFRPWVAAAGAASVAIIAGTVGIWDLTRTEQPRPTALAPQGPTLIRAPTDASVPQSAPDRFREESRTGKLAELSPRSDQPGGVALPTRETPVKRGAKPALPQQKRPLEPTMPPDDSRLATCGNEPSNPAQGAPLEPTRLATAPAGRGEPTHVV